MALEVIEAELGRAEHAEALVALLDSYARDPMGGGSGLSDYAKAHLPRALAQREDSVVLLAYMDGSPVGVTTCIEGFSTFACQPLLNIHDIAVLPEYRGRGIASRMLEAAEALARRRGCCKLTLEVLSGNTIAQAVYARFGFAQYQLDPSKGQAQFWHKPL